MKNAKHTAHDQHNFAAASLALARMKFIHNANAETLAEVRRWEVIAETTKQTVLAVIAE